MEFHPLANVFPLIEGDEFQRLVADVGANGVLEPVWLYEEKILDGRNRYRAALETGRKFKTREYTGEDPVGLVVSLNATRRQSTASQLACVALNIEAVEAERAHERMTVGVNQYSSPSAQMHEGEKGRATEKAADAVGVSWRYVAYAKKIKSLDEEIFDKVWKGGATITQARRELKERQREERREENREKVALAPEPEKAIAGKFATIVIDPPWDWGDEGDQDQLGRARPKYETMSIEELLALPVGDFADDDCHLYLWITNRSLPKGFGLLERWGFRYVTMLTWVKPHFGMGNYFRGQTEHILFGVRGSQMLKRKDVGTVFSWPRGPDGHSSKPVESYEMIESCSPGPYLEMFSRSERPDWTMWGEASREAA